MRSIKLCGSNHGDVQVLSTDYLSVEIGDRDQDAKELVRRAAVKFGLIPASATTVRVVHSDLDLVLAVYVGGNDLYKNRTVSEAGLLQRLTSHLGGKFASEQVSGAFAGRDLPASETEYVRMVDEAEFEALKAKRDALANEVAALDKRLVDLAAKK